MDHIIRQPIGSEDIIDMTVGNAQVSTVNDEQCSSSTPKPCIIRIFTLILVL